MVVRRSVVGLIVLVMAIALVPAGSIAQDDTTPPPEVVVLARSDNPADALGAGPVAGVFGAPVLVTPSAFLIDVAADQLTAINPDLVVLAGGEAALSAQVQADVEALGFEVRRIAGADRHDTAAQLAGLLAEYGLGRPVLSGRNVTDAVVPGLNAALLDGMTAEELIAQGGGGEQGPAGPAGPQGEEGPPGLDLGDNVVVVPATGNETADGDALRAAVAQISASGAPGVVQLGAGTYDVGSASLALESSMALAGQGSGVTHVIGSPPGGSFNFPDGGALIDVTDVSGLVEIRDLTLEASSGSESYSAALQARGADVEVTLSGVRGTLETASTGTAIAYTFYASFGATLTLDNAIAELPSALNAISPAIRGLAAGTGGHVLLLRGESHVVQSGGSSTVEVRDAVVRPDSDGLALRSVNNGTLLVAGSLIDGTTDKDANAAITCVFSYGADYVPIPDQEDDCELS